MAFFINADDSPRRREFMERQLAQGGVRYERWPAIRGGPQLLKTHARYFRRGVEKHLYLNRSEASGVISGWGTIGTYLSHLTLFEHIVRRWPRRENASFLILQDDTLLKPGWLRQLGSELSLVSPLWARVLLVWWGLERQADCRGHFCAVRPPAGPTEAGPECCGKRFYHGLQAWLVRTHSLECLVPGILLKNQLASPNRTERLKSEYRADHPHYPYSNHNPETSVDRTLSMCFKLAIVGQLRNRSRMRYDLVWRTRTDFYVVNVSWPLLRTLMARHRAATLPPPSASQTPAPKYLPWFLTPTIDERLQWFHQMTDVEAFLSEPAAARYDSWWWKIPSLYASGVVFHPETMLTALMHAGLARFHDPQMKVPLGLMSFVSLLVS
eukprot:jgi/Chrpa1/438/Chrysochromulina_OHIO_Genome00014191-RA